MEKTIDEHCREALEAKNKTPSIEGILKLLDSNSALSIRVAENAGFPLAILQIITDSFYLLNTKNFDKKENHNVKICLDVLRILVENTDIKGFLLDAQFDYYAYPFLLAATDEELRVSTLKFFCSLLQDGMPVSMRGGELLPLLLKVVDFGSEESQALSLDALALILQGSGLDYAVQTLDRFQAIDVVLGALLTKSIFAKNIQLLKRLFRIYLRLCDKSNVNQKLREKLPEGIDSKDAVSLCEQDEELSELRKRFLQATR